MHRWCVEQNNKNMTSASRIYGLKPAMIQISITSAFTMKCLGPWALSTPNRFLGQPLHCIEEMEATGGEWLAGPWQIPGTSWLAPTGILDTGGLKGIALGACLGLRNPKCLDMLRPLVDSTSALSTKLVSVSFSSGKPRFSIYKYNLKLEFWPVKKTDSALYSKIG